MKKLWLISVLALTLTLAACGNNNATNDTGSGGGATGGGGTQPTPPPTVSVEPPADLDEIRGNTNPSQELRDFVNFSLEDSFLANPHAVQLPSDYSQYPVSSDRVLKIWAPINSSILSVMQSFNEHPVYSTASVLTGIRVDVNSPPIGQENEQFNLMVAGRDLPDIVIDHRYPGGAEAGVNDGAFLDLTDLIPQFAPNFHALRHENETIRRGTVTDNGRIVQMHGISPYPEWIWFGMLIKEDALDATGLPVPETLAEWETFLEAAQNAGFTNPLNYGSNYGQIFTGIINGAFGVWDWLFNDNGTVGWGPVQPRAMEYLALMQDWNARGFLNPDWLTADFHQRMASAISSDTAVMMDSPDTMWSFWKVDNNIDFVGALNPVENRGERSQTTWRNWYTTGTHAVVTSMAQDPALALAWLDFGFSKKGWQLYNYGLYGDTHLIDENGRPFFPEDGIIYNDPILPVNTHIWTSRIHIGANIRDEHYSNPLVVAPGSYSGDIRRFWSENMSTDYAMPPVTLLPSEVSEEANIGGQIDTLRREFFARIVLGDLPVEAWNDFHAAAQQAGLARFLEIWQGALDRYNAR